VGLLVKKLGSFIVERAGSVVSKKLGVTLAAEGSVAIRNPDLVGWPSIIYVIVLALGEAAERCFKYWADTRND
jgi:hypothetical protein